MRSEKNLRGRSEEDCEHGELDGKLPGHRNLLEEADLAPLLGVHDSFQTSGPTFDPVANQPKSLNTNT